MSDSDDVQLEGPYDWDKHLKGNGMKTTAEVTEYKKSTGWVPYEQYMKEIYYHHPGREFDDFNMSQNWLDKQTEPNRLLREAAYLLGLQHRSTNSQDAAYTHDDQKHLEEDLYRDFMLALFNRLDHNNAQGPWPEEEH